MKTLLLRIGIAAVAIVAILLGINAYFVWRNGARLESQLAELRAAGDPISLKDLARAPIPPEKNAATYLRRAQSDLEAIEKELIAILTYSKYPGGPYEPGQQEKVEKVFSDFPRVIPLLEQAASCPDYDFQINYTAPAQTLIERLVPDVQKERLVARVLQARSILLAAKGRRDEALASMILLLKLGRHFDREPALIVGYLVATACRNIAIHEANLILQSGPVDKPSREALEGELARYDPVQPYVWALKRERAFGLDLSREMPWNQHWLGRAFSYTAQSYYLEMVGGYLEKASCPYDEVKPVEPTSPWQSRFGPSAAVDLLSPALNHARIIMENSRAAVRALRVLNALQSKVAPDAKEPPELSDLGLPAEVTIDPFNGQPLHVKRVPAGWLVYSVGQNLVDDGGVLGFDPQSDVGVGPPGSERKAEKK